MVRRRLNRSATRRSSRSRGTIETFDTEISLLQFVFRECSTARGIEAIAAARTGPGMASNSRRRTSTARSPARIASAVRPHATSTFSRVAQADSRSGCSITKPSSAATVARASPIWRAQSARSSVARHASSDSRATSDAANSSTANSSNGTPRTRAPATTSSTSASLNAARPMRRSAWMTRCSSSAASSSTASTFSEYPADR